MSGIALGINTAFNLSKYINSVGTSSSSNPFPTEMFGPFHFDVLQMYTFSSGEITYTLQVEKKHNYLFYFF